MQTIVYKISNADTKFPINFLNSKTPNKLNNRMSYIDLRYKILRFIVESGLHCQNHLHRYVTTKATTEYLHKVNDK